MTTKIKFQVGLAAVAALFVALPAQAAIDCASDGVGTEGNITVDGGQVNMAGATLFVDFFRQPSSTNDWIDANGDGFFGFVNPDPTFRFVDQLANEFIPGSALNTWWTFNYRSVGSVNGFGEFIDSQLCDELSMSPPSEAGIFNRFEYANDGAVSWGGPYANSTGTPIEQCSIDGSFLDVPGSWAVVGTGSEMDAAWDKNPTAAGYGMNYLLSSSDDASQLQQLTRACTMDSLNFNDAAPDGDTLFSETAAWVPVTPIANRGTGLENVKFSELQYHFVTGRLPSGENLAGVTRDVGSGTRNAAMNSLNIDPSWGRGDNVGTKIADSDADKLGPLHQTSNKGGSSRMEDTTRNNRLAVGYTGLAGSSRSARDATQGKYEVLNVCKDVDENGTPLCDCDIDGYVRPSIDTTLDNCDACTGWQIAGSGSFVVRGDIDANRDMADPNYSSSGVPVENQAVADYLNNIFDSIAVFEGNVFGGECGTSLSCSSNGMDCEIDADCGMGGGTCTVPRGCDSNNDCDAGDYCGQIVNSPGQGLATQFFLPAALDCEHNLTNPMVYFAAATNQDLQDYTRANNGLGWNGDTPAFGSVNVAGQAPSRLVVAAGVYSDGQAQAYVYWNGSSYVDLPAHNDLSARNRIQGDMNEDGARTVADATELVSAYYTPRAWQKTAPAIGGGATGDMSADNAVPEILGDFDGDGNLTKEDLRYFADGLAMNAGSLDRKAGAIAIDTQIVALGKDLPWADTNAMLVVPPAATYGEPTFTAPAAIAGMFTTGKTYAAGDFRGDVAGANPTAGAHPMGWDGKIDAADIDYVCASTPYDWSNLDEAVFMDISCDMDGDLDVDTDDVTELVVNILGTQYGDADLDGDVDMDDEAVVTATIAAVGGCNDDASCGWSDGDFTCDGVVDAADQAFFGVPCAESDVDCDGSTNAGDILVVRSGLNWNQTAGTAAAPRCDVDGNGQCNAGDILVIRSGLNWNTATGPCTCP